MPIKPSTFDAQGFFKNLSDALAGFMIWSWDDRYDTVVGKFRRQDAEQVIYILERHFTAMWDPAVIETASEIEQEVNRQLGGIESGQALYTTDPNVGKIVFCAWWRWSDGKHFSLRIGASSFLPKGSATEEELARLREIFRVE